MMSPKISHMENISRLSLVSWLNHHISMAAFFFLLFVGSLIYIKCSVLKLYKRKQLSAIEWIGTGKAIPVFDMAPCSKTVWKSGCVILPIFTPSTRETSQLQVPVALLPGIYRTGGLTKPSVFLRIMQERNLLCLCRQSNPRSPTSFPVDWFLYWLQFV